MMGRNTGATSSQATDMGPPGGSETPDQETSQEARAFAARAAGRPMEAAAVQQIVDSLFAETENMDEIDAKRHVLNYLSRNPMAEADDKEIMNLFFGTATPDTTPSPGERRVTFGDLPQGKSIPPGAGEQPEEESESDEPAVDRSIDHPDFLWMLPEADEFPFGEKKERAIIDSFANARIYDQVKKGKEGVSMFQKISNRYAKNRNKNENFARRITLLKGEGIAKARNWTRESSREALMRRANASENAFNLVKKGRKPT